MYVKYAASIEKVNGKEAMWVGDDKSVFENVSDSCYYNKEIYFYPSTPAEPVWLWVMGHERSSPSKAVINRRWYTRWVFHICVGGKGYYNGKPIGRGDCFLTWPDLKHSVTVDEEDPLEFYWIILRGKEMKDFIHNYGFRNTQTIFSTRSVDKIVELFELGMDTDFGEVNIYEYTMSLVKMIFSYHKCLDDSEDANTSNSSGGYVHMAKQLLRDSNYSLYVSDVAMKLGITPKHLNKVFSRETKESIKQYITRKRFSAAEKFLKTGMPPTEVARIVGYSTYTAFYRAFVAKYSMTPSEYVKRMKSEESE